MDLDNIINNRYETNVEIGLSSKQVQERISKNLTNRVIDENEKTNKQIIKENIFTYFNFIFLVLSILVVISGSFRNLTFLPVIIINTFIGIIQEIRSKKILSKIKMLNEPKTTVIRDGKKEIIYSQDLVLDDIVIFSNGNQITADAIVVKGEANVNESLLTGEANEIKKEQGSKLFSGSYVVSGECYARIDKVGSETYIAKLSKEAKKSKNSEQSEMIRSLDKLLKIIGIIIVPIGIVLFIQGYLINHHSFQKTIVTMVAAIIGMIPEGLYLLTTIALALSAMKLAKQNVLLHDMKSIETLSRVDVLCVDKTGTITENIMEVKALVYIENNHINEDDLNLLIGDFVSNIRDENTTMKALKQTFINNRGINAKKVYDFSSKYKYSAMIIDSNNYVLGAPEFILKDNYHIIEKNINTYIEKGYRILAFGKYNGELDGLELKSNTDLLGFIVLSNRIRKNAKKTFEYFNKQNVDIKVISGDNPKTVSQVALDAGIKNYDQFIDASTLSTKEDIENAVSKYTIFGRVTPNQKEEIVMALKKQGHTVAMTGDGINDILALKKADCSIAMASGSEATAHASQLVLLDSDFSHMPLVVLEGRRVVNNIQRSASLFLVKNIFSIVMSLLTILFMVTYPLEPAHISLISMFTIGIPGYFLALETNNRKIEGNFLKNIFLKAFPAALTNIFAISVLVVCREIFGLSPVDVSTAATLLLSLVGFMVLYDISKPLNRYRKLIIIGNFAGLIICSIVFGKLFAIESMSKVCIIMFITLSFAAESFFRYCTKIFQFITHIEIKVNDK